MKEVHEIMDELEDAVVSLDAQLESLEGVAMNYVNARSDYTDLKEQYLLELKDEEIKDPKIKRTDAIRAAMYRVKYKDERRAWLAAEAMNDITWKALRGLETKVKALQSQLKAASVEFGTGHIDRPTPMAPPPTVDQAFAEADIEMAAEKPEAVVPTTIPQATALPATTPMTATAEMLEKAQKDVMAALAAKRDELDHPPSEEEKIAEEDAIIDQLAAEQEEAPADPPQSSKYLKDDYDDDDIPF